jgi:hypothetical protein
MFGPPPTISTHEELPPKVQQRRRAVCHEFFQSSTVLFAVGSSQSGNDFSRRRSETGNGSEPRFSKKQPAS